MKLNLATVTLATALLGAPVLAQDVGNAEAGAKVFNKCQTCHIVADADGNVLAGKAGKIGPNLYGVVGRVAGSYPDFKYGKGIELLLADGYVWTEADLAVYVMNPTKFLDERTSDPKAKSLMAFKLSKPQEGLDVAAFLVSLAPPVDAAAAPAADGAAAPASN